MITFFTPLSIFLATIAGFAVGIAWYSPYLFHKAWMKGEGLTKSKLPKRNNLYVAQVNFYALIAHGVIAIMLAFMFEILSIPSLLSAVSLGLLLTFGFVVTTRFMDMVYTTTDSHYEAQPQMKFLVGSGYYLVVSVVMSVVLFTVSFFVSR